jgi:hypothetical protein
MAADVASVQFSRTVERHERRPVQRLDGHALGHGLAVAGGRRSLKTQQHAGIVCGPARSRSPSSEGASRAPAIQPGSVDMLGPIRLDIARLEGWRPRGPVSRRILDRGTA